MLSAKSDWAINKANRQQAAIAMPTRVGGASGRFGRRMSNPRPAKRGAGARWFRTAVRAREPCGRGNERQRRAVRDRFSARSRRLRARILLATIGERPVDGFSTWSTFLARRMRPAMRTCTTTEERQANLSQKLARAAHPLRTRVDVELEQQNRHLL